MKSGIFVPLTVGTALLTVVAIGVIPKSPAAAGAKEPRPLVQQAPEDEAAREARVERTHISFSAKRTDRADGLRGDASIMISEPLIKPTTNETVRAIAVVSRIDRDAPNQRRLHSSHQLKFVAVDQNEPIEYGAMIGKPADPSAPDGDIEIEYAFEVVIQPAAGLTWAEVAAESDLDFQFTLSK